MSPLGFNEMLRYAVDGQSPPDDIQAEWDAHCVKERRRVAKHQAARERRPVSVATQGPSGAEGFLGNAVDEPPESWQPVDLGPALRGDIEPVTPTILERDDGKALFYRGRVNGIHGDSGLGKSMAAAVAAAAEIKAGRDVVWIDLEDPDATTLIERLRIFSVTDEQIAAHLTYHSPKDPSDRWAIDLIESEIIELEATLVVIDSVGEAFGLDGINEDKDNEVGPWLRRFPRRLADTGAAVVLIDHATKAGDNPLHPSGSKRKRAAITGAGYLIDAPQPLTRDKGGKLKLTCAKDRHGHYRRGEITAHIVMTMYPDGGATIHVEAPVERDTNPRAELRAIARAAIRAARDADHPPSLRQLLEMMAVKASRDKKIAGIELAVQDGALRSEAGKRGASIHHFVRDLADQ